MAALVAAAVTTGLSAGFFSTYQWSVTRGLAQVDDTTYVRAFQEINATVRTGWFAVVFFGSAIFGALATVFGIVQHASRRVVALIGAATVCYIAGVLAVTFAGNVPLNDDLAEHTLTTDFPAARAAFEDDWNALNLIRALAATATFALALAATFVELRETGRGDLRK